MIIRKATLKEAPYIAKVQVSSWKSTYRGIVPDRFLDAMLPEERIDGWKERLQRGNVFVAESGGTIIGFAVGGPERSGKYKAYAGELYAIYILQEFQGEGLGKRLVHAVMEDLLEQGLTSMLVWVLEENAARKFYEKMGGTYVDQDLLLISGKSLVEVAYGWKRIGEETGKSK